MPDGADSISEAELEEIFARCNDATPGPWVSYVEGRDHWGGDHFIMRGEGATRGEDLYLTCATIEDQEFIANARQDVPRLVAEIRRLRRLLIERGEL
jgi:hypothetical protein